MTKQLRYQKIDTYSIDRAFSKDYYFSTNELSLHATSGPMKFRKA